MRYNMVEHMTRHSIKHDFGLFYFSIGPRVFLDISTYKERLFGMQATLYILATMFFSFPKDNFASFES